MSNSCSPFNYFDQLGGKIKEFGIVCMFLWGGNPWDFLVSIARVWAVATIPYSLGNPRRFIAPGPGLHRSKIRLLFNNSSHSQGKS